jgi:hypothetical protein
VEVHDWTAVITIFLVVAGGVFGYVWNGRIEHKRELHKLREQTEAHLREFRDENNNAHDTIHSKIGDVNEKSEKRHGIVRDKLEDIYRHLLHKDGHR